MQRRAQLTAATRAAPSPSQKRLLLCLAGVFYALPA
jgi:hypothetical protein